MRRFLRAHPYFQSGDIVRLRELLSRVSGFLHLWAGSRLHPAHTARRVGPQCMIEFGCAAGPSPRHR
jgi:hypothetical protein